jgi:uncharacterized protein YjbI with pentapeptide repeats
MSITKQEVLDNLEEVKKYIEEAENKKEEKVIGIAIKNRFTGEIIFQSTKTTWKEAVVEGKANLCDADLCGADLCDAGLSEADLREADLRDTDLREAGLRDANLRGANLSGADLRGADLCDADLREADLREADLRGANLASAKFYGRGGHKKLTKDQVPVFLSALGFDIED